MVLGPETLPGVEFKTEIALVAAGGGADLWDTALWDTAVWSGNEVDWIDVTGRAEYVQTSRGRDSVQDTTRAGSATFELSNQDGIFNPDVGGSVGAQKLRPGRWVRISGRVKGAQDWVPIWTGEIDVIDESYTSGAHRIRTRFDAIDFFARWGRDNPPALTVPRTAELTSERLAFLLDEVGWPTGQYEVPVDLPDGTTWTDETGRTWTSHGNDVKLVSVPFQWRSIDTGLHQMQSSDLAADRLSEMRKCAQAEGGDFYISAWGTPTFVNYTNSTYVGIPAPKLTIGGIADELQIIDARTIWDAVRVRNDIQYARVGGTALRAFDSASRSQYGGRSFRRFDFENASDIDLQKILDRDIEDWKWDTNRIERISVVALTAEAATELLELELGDVVQTTIATAQGWGQTQVSFVRRIAHRVSGSDWVVDLRLDNADNSAPFEGGPYSAAFGSAFDTV